MVGGFFLPGLPTSIQVSEAVCRIRGEAKAEGEAGQNTHCIPTKKLGIRLGRSVQAGQRLPLPAGRSLSRPKGTGKEPAAQSMVAAELWFSGELCGFCVLSVFAPAPGLAMICPPRRGLRGALVLVWAACPALSDVQGGGVAEKVPAPFRERYRSIPTHPIHIPQELVETR